FKRYMPLVGESSRPRIERRVDLPQPDGPAIEMNSPCAISRWMPESACVSTSSVKKTLVTPSSRMTGCPLELIASPYCRLSTVDCRLRSSQPHPIERVPRGHVGKDHFVSGLQPVEHLDGVDRALAEAHLDAHGFVAVGLEAEESDRALLGPESRPADVNDVGQVLELDRAV